MNVRLVSVKGKVIEITCSAALAVALGSTIGTGQPPGDYLVMRTREGQTLVWPFHRRALDR